MYDRLPKPPWTKAGCSLPCPPGQSVAVGVGSRGIANLPIIVKAVVDRFREAGLHPFTFRLWAATAEPPQRASGRSWKGWA